MRMYCGGDSQGILHNGESDRPTPDCKYTIASVVVRLGATFVAENKVQRKKTNLTQAITDLTQFTCDTKTGYTPE